MLLNSEIRTTLLDRRHQRGEVAAKTPQHLRWNSCGGLTGIHPVAQFGDLLWDAQTPAQGTVICGCEQGFVEADEDL